MKLFFMHIPKTAGTSLRRFLERSVRECGGSCSVLDLDGVWSEKSESYLDYDTFVSEAGRPHRETDLVCGHYPHHVRTLLAPDTVVVTILREPLARCLSHIKHQMALERQTGHPEAMSDVNAFIAAPRNEMFLRTLANLAVKYFSYEGHPDALIEDAELSFERALAHCQASRFGFDDEIEHFQERLNAEFFGRVASLPILRENRSSEPSVAADLTPANRGLLTKLNELDVELCARARTWLE